MTPAQVAANSANAQKSTGPRTEAGKAASRSNAVDHGLCADVVLLPGEDVHEYERTRAAWHAELQPVGVVEGGFVDAAVAASWALRRGRRHEAATLSRRARDAYDHFEADQQAAVHQLVKSLKSDPAGTVLALSQTAAGCDQLLERWQALRSELERHATWGPTHLVQALALSGCRPSSLLEDEAARDLAAHAARLILPDELDGPEPEDESVRCDWNEARRAVVGAWLAPHLGAVKARPIGWEYALGHIAFDLPDSQEEAFTGLYEFIDAEIEALTVRHDEHAARLESDRAQAAAEAGLMDVTATGGLRLRYLSAHRRALDHALRELARLQKQRRSDPAHPLNAPDDGWAANVAAEPEEASSEPESEPMPAPLPLRNEAIPGGARPEIPSKHMDVIPLREASIRTERGAGGACVAR